SCASVTAALGAASSPSILSRDFGSPGSRPTTIDPAFNIPNTAATSGASCDIRIATRSPAAIPQALWSPRLKRVAATFPSRVALGSTYRELNETANRLAARLQGRIRTVVSHVIDVR